MSDADAVLAAPVPADVVVETDGRRRSFAALLGARTAAQVFDQAVDLGAAIVLATRTTSALAIVIALSAHKYVTAFMAPAMGRLSDRTRSPLGRRVPHMAAGLAAAAVATSAIAAAPGYWALAACLVSARLGLTVFRVARFAATPDIFGRSRWAHGMLVFAVLGAVPQLGVLVLIRQTWDQDDPSTWDLPFQVAGLALAAAAVAVVLLVREAPGARVAAEEEAGRSWRALLAEVLTMPHARVLLASGGLLAATAAAVGRLLPIWAAKDLGVGPDGLVDLGAALAAGAVLVAPVGLRLASRVHPRTLAVAASLVGASCLGSVAMVSAPWGFVGLVVASVPLTVAAVAALAPTIAELVPRSGGVGAAFGSVLGPFALVTTLGGFVAALAVDLASEPAAIWVVASALLVLNAGVLTRLRLPAGHRTSRSELRAMARRAGRQAGVVVEADDPDQAGASSTAVRVNLSPRRHLAALFGGTVDDDDVVGTARAPAHPPVEPDRST